LKELYKIYVPDDVKLQYRINTLRKRMQGWSGTLMGMANFLAHYMDQLTMRLQQHLVKKLGEAVSTGFPDVAHQWSRNADSYVEHLSERPLPKANVERTTAFLAAVDWSFLGGIPPEEESLVKEACALLARLQRRSDGSDDWEKFSTEMLRRRRRCVERWRLIQQEQMELERRWSELRAETDTSP
jgi:hypothetical protein